MPEVLSAKVIGDREVQVGSRVKHFGQRYTGCATATVVALRAGEGGYPEDWVRVEVKQDHEGSWPSDVWDWDRVEVAPDV